MTHANSDLKDWASLYRPLGKYLLASYRHLLQVKMTHVAQQILPSLQKQYKIEDIRELPTCLANNAMKAIPANAAALSLTKVDFKDPLFQQILQHPHSSSSNPNEGLGQELYDDIKKIFQEHQHQQ